MFAARAQQLLDVREYLLLLRCAAVSGEGVFGIADPASGKIVAIVWIGGAWHSNLIAVIQLRNSAQGKRQTRSHITLPYCSCFILEMSRGVIGRVSDARNVVIAKECNE